MPTKWATQNDSGDVRYVDSHDAANEDVQRDATNGALWTQVLVDDGSGWERWQHVVH